MEEKTLSEEALSYGWKQAKFRFRSVKYLIGCIIYAAIVGIGFLLFIIPGIWLAIKLQYFAMFTLGIGLIWFVPTALVAYGFAYMRLSGQLAPAAQPAPAPAAAPAQ